MANSPNAGKTPAEKFLKPVPTGLASDEEKRRLAGIAFDRAPIAGRRSAAFRVNGSNLNSFVNKGRGHLRFK